MNRSLLIPFSLIILLAACGVLKRGENEDLRTKPSPPVTLEPKKPEVKIERGAPVVTVVKSQTPDGAKASQAGAVATHVKTASPSNTTEESNVSSAKIKKAYETCLTVRSNSDEDALYCQGAARSEVVARCVDEHLRFDSCLSIYDCMNAAGYRYYECKIIYGVAK